METNPNYPFNYNFLPHLQPVQHLLQCGPTLAPQILMQPSWSTILDPPEGPPKDHYSQSSTEAPAPHYSWPYKHTNAAQNFCLDKRNKSLDKTLNMTYLKPPKEGCLLWTKQEPTMIRHQLVIGQKKRLAAIFLLQCCKDSLCRSFLACHPP